MQGWIQHGDVAAVPLHHIELVGLMLLVTMRESLSLGDLRLCHEQSAGWPLMPRHGCLSGNLPIQQPREEQSRAEQAHLVLSKPSPTYSSVTPQALGSVGE